MLQKLLFTLIILINVFNQKNYASEKEQDLFGEIQNSSKDSNILLNFFETKLTPFLAKRIDYLLLKNGFNDHLQRVLNLDSDISYEIIKKSEEQNPKVLQCGQIGSFNIIFEDYNHSVKNNDFEKEEITLNIGTSGLGSSFDIGVLNMKEGEERLIRIKKIDPNLRNIKQKTPFEKKIEKNSTDQSFLRVKLNKIPDSHKNLEIEEFYKEENLKKIKTYHILKSLNPQIHCGSPVFLEFKILNDSGNEIFNSENQSQAQKNPFNFFIGSGKMPQIIEWALNGMHYNDQKIVFIKNSDLKDLVSFIKNPELKEIIQNSSKNIILELNPKFLNNLKIH